MAETRAAIRERVQRFVGKAINSTIDEAIKQAYKDMHLGLFNYSFMEKSKVIPVAEGATTFALPDDFKEELNPEMGDAQSLGYQRMSKILVNGIEARRVDDSGRPLSYRIFGGEGKLYNTADQAYSFRLEYYCKFPDLEDDEAPAGNAGAFLDEASKAIEYYAIGECKRRLNQYSEGDYWEKRGARLQDDLENRDVARAMAGQDLKMEIPG